MAFPASLSSLPAAVVLIFEAAPFRAMSETLNRTSVHLEERWSWGDLEYFKLSGAGGDPAASIYWPRSETIRGIDGEEVTNSKEPRKSHLAAPINMERNVGMFQRPRVNGRG